MLSITSACWGGGGGYWEVLGEGHLVQTESLLTLTECLTLDKNTDAVDALLV